MSSVIQSLLSCLSATAPWWGAFLGALALTLALVPPVRALNRRLGMVDAPSARRINTTPIPRGGGLAIYLALLALAVIFPHVFGRSIIQGILNLSVLRLLLPPTLLVLIGYADDKFGLPPLVKLLGQIMVAVLAVFWFKLGFSGIFPQLPFALDAALTIF